MLPEAIFFDLDDTIISFEGAAETAWKEMCYSFADSYTRLQREMICLFPDSINTIEDLLLIAYSNIGTSHSI